MRADSLRCRFLATVYWDSSRTLDASQEQTIPGKPTALAIEMLPRIPDLTLRSDGAEYNEKPLVTRFRVYNDSWVRQTLAQTDFTIKGPGLNARTALRRTPSSASSSSARPAATPAGGAADLHPPDGDVEVGRHAGGLPGWARRAPSRCCSPAT